MAERDADERIWARCEEALKRRNPGFNASTMASMGSPTPREAERKASSSSKRREFGRLLVRPA